MDPLRPDATPGQQPPRGASACNEQAVPQSIITPTTATTTTTAAPEHRSSMPLDSPDIALHDNANSVRDLEKDLRNAARVGEALLVRHESYVAEAEAERSRSDARVSSLESSNHELRLRNTHLERENQRLQDQIEDITNAVMEADNQVQSLRTTLSSTQRELERMTRLSKRTEELELQLFECEREQTRLQATLNHTVEEERAANQRWKAAERKILQIEEQMEAIEAEAQRERMTERNNIERLERTLALERKAKQDQASDEEPSEHRSREVVSNFVKDILQDNANMQLAMIELQEALASYRDHTSPQSVDLGQPFNKGHASLSEELAGSSPDQHRQEYHVHHHYHGPNQDKAKPQPVRQRKRRPKLSSGLSSSRPPSRAYTADNPRSPYRHKATSSTSSSVFSNDQRSKRWSFQSTDTTSSMAFSDATSPSNYSYCPSTIFERPNDQDNDYASRPTTAAGSEIWSPVVKPTRASRFNSQDLTFQQLSLPPHPHLTPQAPALGESPTRTPIQSPSRSAQVSSATPKPIDIDVSRSHTLRRTTSHSSLLSISGMDIHSSLNFAIRTPKFPMTARNDSGPVLTAVNVSASTDGALRSALAKSLKARPIAEGSPSARYDLLQDTLAGLKGVGGWFSSRWTGSSTDDQQSRGTTTPTSQSSASKTMITVLPKAAGEASTNPIVVVDSTALHPKPEIAESSANTILDDDKSTRSSTSLSTVSEEVINASRTRSTPNFRSAGINQPGGLPPLPIPRSKVAWMKGKVDEEALKESLEG